MRLRWIYKVVELVDLVKDGVKGVDKSIDFLNGPLWIHSGLELMLDGGH